VRPRSFVVASALLLAACGKTENVRPIEWHEIDEGERLARSTGKPVVIYACAEWSVACKEMEKHTFADLDVRAAMRDFVGISIDATDDDDASTQRATERFGLRWLPTIIIRDDGHELFRITEVVPPKAMLGHLRQAKKAHDARTRRR